MPGEQVHLTLIGADADDGLVRLDDFGMLCSHLRTCLREVERSLSEREPTVQFRIVDLECASASLAVEPVPATNGFGYEVVETFRDTVARLERGDRVDGRLSFRALEAFRDLYKPVWNKRESRTRLRVDTIELSTAFLTTVNSLLETPLRALGSVSGMLDRVNVHSGKSEFYVYPPVGDFHVTCRFKKTLLPKVREGLKRHVTVTGLLYYPADSPFPVRADASDLEIHANDDDLPRLWSMRGVAKDDDGPDSVTIVRGLRDEWE